MIKFVFLVAIIVIHVPSVCAQNRSAWGENGVVVSVSEHASKVGIEMLKKGGNAIDAAVATALVLAVTYPQAGNIGGGGFMLIRMSDGTTTGIDYREKAPAASHDRMFLRADGSVDTMRANYGYLVAGIPGTIRGLEYAWKKYGRLDWRDIVLPAVRIAEAGFEVYPVVANSLAEEARYLSLFEESRKLFFRPDGRTYGVGDRLVLKELAGTLRLIADSGASVFYEGSLASRMVEDVRNNGGIWTLDDLKNYRAMERQPIVTTYRGCEIIGMAPPSSGGLTVGECLNIIEHITPKPDDAHSLHILIEAMRRSFFDRMRFQGDPDFVVVPVDKLTSKSYGLKRFNEIDPLRASASQKMNESILITEENLETTHFSIVDREGNAVSNTFTLEDNYGSHAVVKGLGFLLNSEMHDFNIRPDIPNYQGGYGGNPNLIQPGKRMLSSMAPTIVVKDGRTFLITGSPGGRTIINTVVQVIMNRVDFGLGLEEAVARPRLNHNWIPDEVKIERGRWPESIVADLRSRGHRVVEINFLGDAHSITYDSAKKKYHGVADFRRHGWAEGY